MSTKKKIVIDEIALETILPSMFLEILNDYVRSYARSNNFRSYTVHLGHIKKTRVIQIEDTIPIVPRNCLMTREATIIETNLFSKFQMNPSIYEKYRGREILSARYKIQYFMAYYSGMSFKNIGKVTGGVDHSTITYVIKKYNAKINRVSDFKKEIFMLDMNIFHNIGLSESKIFDKGGNIKKPVFRKRLLRLAI